MDSLSSSNHHHSRPLFSVFCIYTLQQVHLVHHVEDILFRSRVEHTCRPQSHETKTLRCVNSLVPLKGRLKSPRPQTDLLTMLIPRQGRWRTLKFTFLCINFKQVERQRKKKKEEEEEEEEEKNKNKKKKKKRKKKKKKNNFICR
ncbi:hypothetical protein M8J76_014835 [Diaphorina citri]|nr:hypothetical protein M8J76_014835 [Diaphorina citri]